MACIDFAEAVLKTFGFKEFKVELSTWDPERPRPLRRLRRELGSGHSLA